MLNTWRLEFQPPCLALLLGLTGKSDQDQMSCILIGSVDHILLPVRISWATEWEEIQIRKGDKIFCVVHSRNHPQNPSLKSILTFRLRVGQCRLGIWLAVGRGVDSIWNSPSPSTWLGAWDIPHLPATAPKWTPRLWTEALQKGNLTPGNLRMTS